MSSTLVTSALLALGAALPLPHDPGLSSVRVVRAADALVVHAAFANADFAAAVPLDRDRDGAIGAAELAAGGAVLERAVLGGFRLRAASDFEIRRGDSNATTVSVVFPTTVRLRFTVTVSPGSADAKPGSAETSSP